MKKKTNKIKGFILQSLIIFAVWLIGTVIIITLDFEKSSSVLIGWIVFVVIGTAVFRMIMSEKNDKK